MAAKPLIKNCYGDAWKTKYSDLRLSTKQTESIGMACSYKYIAAPWDVGGGGMLGLIKIADCGRNPPVIKIKGHTASIQDLAFSPFYESILATGSEDMTIRVWDVPSDPPAGHELKDPVVILSGSAKKVVATEWNPVADFILSSGSFDGAVTLWNVDRGSQVSSVKLGDAVLSVKWSNMGDKLAATSKDKCLAIIDPRTGATVSSVTCHDGPKATKCCWVDGYSGTPGHLISTGFSKLNDREVHLWDLRSMESPVSRIEVDRGSQPLYPVFDETLGFLYITGKGDGNTRYYQIVNQELRRVDDFRTNIPVKSFCFLPKLALDQMKTEVGRMFKNEGGKIIQPISFVVPRKNQDVFQDDLYPPAPDTEPALTTGQWLAGENAEARRILFKPGDCINFQSNKETQKVLKKSGTMLCNAPSVLQKSVVKAEEETKRLEQRVVEQEVRIKDLERQLQGLQSDSTSSIGRIGTIDEGGVEDQLRESAAEIVSLKANLEQASNKLTSALKDLKSKDDEISSLKQQLSELKHRNSKYMEKQLVKVESTIERAASLSGIDDSVKKEFDEMREFFREILNDSITDVE